MHDVTSAYGWIGWMRTTASTSIDDSRAAMSVVVEVYEYLDPGVDHFASLFRGMVKVASISDDVTVLPPASVSSDAVASTGKPSMTVPPARCCVGAA